MVLLQRRHAFQQTARVGMQRAVEQPRDRRLLDDPAGIHHQHAVGGLRDHAHVVGDDDDRHAELVAQVHHQVEDLRLDRDVERGRRLVGDQQARAAGQRDRQHHPLALAAGELVRIVGHAARRRWDADLLQHLQRPRVQRALRQAFMRADRLHDLLADGEHRVERGHRLLEHHGDAGPANALHARIRECGQHLAGEAHLAGGDARGRLRQQAHDGQRGDALAAAGFPDDAEDLAFVEAERHILDRGDLAAAKWRTPW